MASTDGWTISAERTASWIPRGATRTKSTYCAGSGRFTMGRPRKTIAATSSDKIVAILSCPT